MVNTEANPDGSPIEVFDGLRADGLADRSKLYRDLASGPFFGFNRPGAIAALPMAPPEQSFAKGALYLAASRSS